MLIGLIPIFGQNGEKSELSEEEISELTSKLEMKLLLNDSQKSSIKDLLNNYSVESQKIISGESSYKNKEELISSINSKVKSLLDSKQKMKYDILEKEWWASINEEEND